VVVNVHLQHLNAALRVAAVYTGLQDIDTLQDSPARFSAGIPNRGLVQGLQTDLWLQMYVHERVQLQCRAVRCLQDSTRHAG
jgi:hypothetical protein